MANDPRGAKTSAGLFSAGRSESCCNSHYDKDANFPSALIWFFWLVLFCDFHKVRLYRLIPRKNQTVKEVLCFSPVKGLWRISSCAFLE